MAIRRPAPNFDQAATEGSGRLNLELRNSLENTESRMRVIERAIGVTGLDPDRQRKVAPAPPRADVDVQSTPGVGFTVSITNPEFIPERGNPLRTPIYHRVSYSPDPRFRTGVITLPPGVQTHWPIQAKPGTKVYTHVLSSYDGHNWNQPIIHGPIAV